MSVGRPIFAFLIAVAIAAPAFSESPKDQIKKTTDQILSILTNPLYKGPSKAEERRRLIRKAIDERFDWEGMAQRALGIHWAKRTVEERKEFVGLFEDLLARTYMDKIEGYSGEKIVYAGETIDGDKARAFVKIITSRNKEIPLEYRLQLKESQWLVYDISIEGVSLVNNYRTQFNSIIVKSGYEDLVKRLKEKQAYDDKKERRS